jgi:glycosyltransferase involved in cell wall biosynthesis
MRIAVHDYAGHAFQFELSRQLARQGHEVCHFFFAGDAGPKGDARRLETDSETFSVQPIETPGEYRKDRFFQRRANDIVYGRIAGARIAAFRPDVVISGNTPLDAQAPLMAALRARTRAAFVFWMQDFYSLAITRIIGGKWRGLGAVIAAWYRRMERRQLAQSDGVVLISEGFRAELGAFGVPDEKVHVIPNWGAIDAIPVRPRDNDWTRRMGVGRSAVALYSGTLGLKHDPNLLLALADDLKARPDALVIVASEGAGAQVLRAAQEAQPRQTLRLEPLQPMADFPDMLGAADIFLAVLEADAGRFSVPSKVLSYLCAGRPIVLSAPAENLASDVLRESGAGILTPPGDEAAFVAAARRLLDDASLRQTMGEAGRAYAEAHFRIPAVAAAFEKVFEAAIARRAAR